jgi:hypothetical protein
MRVLLIILFVACLAVVVATPHVFSIRAKAQHAATASPRAKALLCWHEFQSGRRATTADCPEL